VTRTIVAAPYPTMPGPEAAATFALVRGLVAAGEDVTVVSPSPSAAHQHADPGSPRGALHLARLAQGADRIIVRLDASALSAGADSARTLPGRLGITAALRRAGRAEVILDRVPPTVSARFVSLVLDPASRIEVATDGERDSLVAAGVEPAKIEVVAPAAPEARPTPIAPLAGTADEEARNDIVALQDLVRRRAAADRASRQRVTAPAEGEASRPLRHMVRMERAQVRSDKPGGALVKRFIAKALAWQFDNVIQHVNRLHQAMIESVDALEATSGQSSVDDTSS